MTDTFAILERVNALYSTAFTQLITYTVGVVALIGILLPIVVAFVQQRRFDAAVGNEVKKLRTELATQVEAEFQKERSAVRGELARLDNMARAGLSSILGKMLADAGKLEGSLLQFCRCISAAAQCGEEGNMRTAIDEIITITGLLTVESVRPQDRVDLSEALKSAWEAMGLINQNNRYSKDIRAFQIMEARMRGKL